MHYYQFNIGDYASHTAHLDHIEDIAYRRMLDWCYTHEKPLPQDVGEISRLIRMRDHSASVRAIINEFFDQVEGGWFSSRVQREIDNFRAKVEQASRAGKASAERRSNGRLTENEQAFNGRSTDVQPTNNHKPITNNHKPIKPKAPATPVPEWLDEAVWSDFKSHRIASKSKMTSKAEALAIGELTKLRTQGHDPTEVIKQSIMRGWKGLFALNGHDNAKGKTRHEQLADKLADLTGQNRRNKPGPEGVIHGTAERVD